MASLDGIAYNASVRGYVHSREHAEIYESVCEFINREFSNNERAIQNRNSEISMCN